MAKKIIRGLTDLLQAVYVLWACVQSIVWIILLIPLGIVPLVFRSPFIDRIAYRFVRFWGQLSSWCAGIFYRVEGREHMQGDTPYIIVANHRSYLDAWVLTAVLSRPFKVLGKEEILKMPLVGFAFKYVGVAVNRSSRKSGMKSLEQLRATLSEQNDVFVFPEGTFTEPGERLSAFRNGAFAIAIDTQTPVLPMVIDEVSRLFPDHSWRMRPGRVRVRFLDPIPTQGLNRKDINGLREEAFRRIRDDLTTVTFDPGG